jgi:hypothetical protein
MPIPASLFLSHSNADNTKLTELVDYLKQKGVRLWYDDQIQPAGAIPRWMSDGLGLADRFLLAWSSSANISPHVWNELDAFYMRKPNPGEILFFKLDETPIPALFASRRYLMWSGKADRDAQQVEKWLSDEDSNNSIQLDVQPPTENLLKLIPKGPHVPQHWITIEIVNAYANILNTAGRSRAVIDSAISLRLAADPGGNPAVIAISITELPIFEYVGPESFWRETLYLACLKGPRMLAALLLAQSDELFVQKARSDRASILQRLRNGVSYFSAQK